MEALVSKKCFLFKKKYSYEMNSDFNFYLALLLMNLAVLDCAEMGVLKHKRVEKREWLRK